MTENENMTLSIDSEVAQNFRMACIKNKKTYSEIAEQLMKEYSRKQEVTA